MNPPTPHRTPNTTRAHRSALAALATAAAVTASPLIALGLASCETTSTGKRQKSSVPQSLKLRQSTMRY
jgi:hypothetical protein